MYGWTLSKHSSIQALKHSSSTQQVLECRSFLAWRFEAALIRKAGRASDKANGHMVPRSAFSTPYSFILPIHYSITSQQWQWQWQWWRQWQWRSGFTFPSILIHIVTMTLRPDTSSFAHVPLVLSLQLLTLQDYIATSILLLLLSLDNQILGFCHDHNPIVPLVPLS